MASKEEYLELPETFVAAGSEGEPGLYFDDRSAFARGAAAGIPGLSSWSHWFNAPWWLRQGDLMTLFATFRRQRSNIIYDRHLLPTLDGGVVALDVVRQISGPPLADTPKGAPFVLLVAGLGGSSHGGYVRNMAAELVRRGFGVAVINMRGTGGSPLRTPRLFSAHRGSTDDVRVAVRFTRKELLGQDRHSEEAAVFLLGWSNGGSIIANTLAEQVSGEGQGHDGRLTSVSGAAALNVPWDNLRSTRFNEARLFSRMTYNLFVARNLAEAVRPHEALFRAGPVPQWTAGQPFVEVDIERVLGASLVSEWDEALTRRVFGFDSLEEYYKDSSAWRRLPLVSAPLLLLSSADDPVAGDWIPFDLARQNPWVLLGYTKHGGHLAWQDEADPRRSRWVEKVVVDFFEHVCSTHDTST